MTPTILLALALSQPCPGGRCPVPATYPQPMPGPGVTVGPGQEWYHVPGVGLRLITVLPTAPGPAVVEARGDRPRLFLLRVRNDAIRGLEERGYTRDQARQMVGKVSDETILNAAEARAITAPGDGGLIDWLRDHREQILALIKLIIQLALLFADPATVAAP